MLFSDVEVLQLLMRERCYLKPRDFIDLFSDNSVSVYDVMNSTETPIYHKFLKYLNILFVVRRKMSVKY